MTLAFTSRIAADTATDPQDTVLLKQALNRLGLYTPMPETGITPFPDRAMIDAIRAFQTGRGLPATGRIDPGDGTEQALAIAAAADTLRGGYIWRTLQDDKVRPSHAERDGRSFAWREPPPGGHPGTEPNCRCWAEPVAGEVITPIPGRKPPPPPCFTDPWKEEAKAHVAEFESLTKHPYLDSVGKITIGYGFNVDRWQDFQALPLRTPDASGQLATELEKLTAFLTLRWVAALISPPPSPEGEPPSPSNRSFGKITANNYKGLTKVQLPEADSRQILDLKISDFETALIGKFGDLACFPSPAKIALMDMIYNLGATRFSADRWPNLFDSVSRRNWSEAADRCRRRGVNVERNNRARGLFLDAADAEVNAISPSIGGSSLGKVGQ
ncbi:MAG: hypothetical protein RLY86_3166 [Pseudomonadota bacterium]|jgi:GH24 family phage-related lysozyme (muramidase)